MPSMVRWFRTLILPAFLALGLLVQGLGVPAMAAPGAATLRSCHLMSGICAKPGHDHHMAGTCQMACPLAIVLPDVGTGAARLQAPMRFAMSGTGLPAGLIRAPDPFPPRPLRTA